MLGAIIGDIVGSRFEFDNTDNYNFELFTKDSTFTDDTICTIAVADAIRRAISWGGDSDTIGAIVGSMAEALWGVPKEISDKAFDLLPTEMLNVVGDFFGNLNRKQYV